MRSIQLRVSPFVRSILRTRYLAPEGEAITVHRADLLYLLLQGDPVRVNDTTVARSMKKLTSTVTLRVSPTIYRRLAARGRQVLVGKYLHAYFQQEMMTWIAAQVAVGQPAQTALRQYLHVHGVSEDDFALETAYMAWQRKKPQNVVQSRQHTVMRENKQLATPCPQVYAPADVLRVCAEYFDVPESALLDQIAHRRVVCYAISVHCGLSARATGAHIGLPLRTVARHRADIRIWRTLYHDVDAHLTAISAALSVLHQPSSM